MAHSPTKKAAAVADLLTGMSQRAVAKKHKVPAGTVKSWADELKHTQNHASTEVRRSRYEEALEGLALSIFGMLKSQAELMSDLDYVRKQSTEDVISHTRFLADRLIAFAELHQRLSSGQPEKHQEPTALPSVAEVESS